jgi:hypothetical protein
VLSTCFAVTCSHSIFAANNEPLSFFKPVASTENRLSRNMKKILAPAVLCLAYTIFLAGIFSTDFFRQHSFLKKSTADTNFKTSHQQVGSDRKGPKPEKPADIYHLTATTAEAAGH